MGMYEDDKAHRESVEFIRMSFISLQRVLRISQKLVENGGEIDKYEINTLKYLFNQCHVEEQNFIKNKFSKLTFLNE